ncbi:hypothetical protein ACHAWT_007020 [Skeletonema menzelii]
MFILTKLLKTVADSKPLLIASGLTEALSVGVMIRRSGYLQSTFGGGNPPDLWIGIPEEKLYNYLDVIGDGGRETYRKINSWDFFPYMPAYMIFYGALLLIQCRSAQASDISWLFLIAMVCDIIETGTFNYAANQFPEHISSTIVRLASIANELKWVSFGFGAIGLVGLFVHNSLKNAKAHQQ